LLDPDALGPSDEAERELLARRIGLEVRTLAVPCSPEGSGSRAGSCSTRLGDDSQTKPRGARRRRLSTGCSTRRSGSCTPRDGALSSDDVPGGSLLHAPSGSGLRRRPRRLRLLAVRQNPRKLQT
jgi:hypothetical protein